MTAYGGIGQGNVLVPTFDPQSTGALQVAFTRRENSYPITRYAQIVPVSDKVGYYLKIDTDEAARVVNEGDYSWPDGTDRPRGSETRHEFVPYRTRRSAYDYQIPYGAKDQARWDLVGTHAKVRGQTAMTHRTYRMLTKLTTVGNWTATVNTDTAANIAGQIGGSSVANKYIQKICEFVVDKIHTNTIGAVNPSDIVLLIGPDVARAIAQAPEIQQFLINYGVAMQFMQRNEGAVFNKYGLLAGLFGVGDVIVENTVRVSTRKNVAATATKAYMLTNSMLFVSRPGGLVGAEGPTFSTATIFAKEDMSVETADDPWNRRINGSVVDDCATELTAPMSGYFVRSVLS